MAKIDIDRHILTEIVGHNRRIKERQFEFRKEWQKIVEVRDKVDALVFHGGVELTEALHSELTTLKKKIYRASKKIDNIQQSVSSHSSKQDALLQHLVTAVEAFYTGKGSESGGLDAVSE